MTVVQVQGTNFMTNNNHLWDLFAALDSGWSWLGLDDELCVDDVRSCRNCSSEGKIGTSSGETSVDFDGAQAD